MMRGEKRDRSVNFTREETDILLSLIETKLDIIENKKSNAVTWQKKEKAWNDIESAFNRKVNGVFRTAKHLKIKYKALNRDRKKTNTIWAEPCYKESNTTDVPLTAVQKKVKEMLQDNKETPVYEEKCEPIYNSDPINNEDEEEYEPASETKKPFDQLVDAKMDVVLLQKQLFHRQIREKILQNKIYEEELKHKRQMHDLEKQHMLLKIELLKIELENARGKNSCTDV